MNLPEINVAIEQLLNDHKDDNIHSLMFYLKKRKELIIEIESKLHPLIRDLLNKIND